MQVIIKNDNLYYLILPFNLKHYKEDEIIKRIKQIFLKYNQKYQLLEPGFYEVLVYSHDIVGTILIVDKIDSFDFSKEIDLKIVIKDTIKLYLKLKDQIEFPEYKKDIDIDTISYQEFLKLLEHSKIIIEQKKFSLRELLQSYY